MSTPDRMHTMTYDEAVAYLYRQLPMYQRIGSKALKVDLTNIEALMEWLGHPHRSFRSIHIAGTNGKGSTAHFIAAGLHASGYKTALYTSPHYLDYRERIKIDGLYISEDSVVQFVSDYQRADLSFQPSFFELTVAMAFWYFMKEKVDIAVIETGLGGRLDSTNVIMPDLSIITNISYDHTDTLGDTLQAIAAEKAGIIKSGVPVIIGRRQPEVQGVFESQARQLGSPLAYADELVPDRHEQFAALTSSDRWIHVPHVHENLRTAVAALLWLDRRATYNIDMDLLGDALDLLPTAWSFMGRWMQLSTSPLVVADSAHNADGVSQLMLHIASLQRSHYHIIMGVVNDKDLDKIWPHMPHEGVSYYYTQMSVPRTMMVEDLEVAGEVAGCPGVGYRQVSEAYDAALKAADQDDMVLIFGSIFLVADLLAYLRS